MSDSRLTYTHIKDALAGFAAAFRLRLKLAPTGGSADKVFPPTYEGGKYATEDRWIDGDKVPCVLLDSVQSQANRMELALQDAWRDGRIQLPVISVDFSEVDHPDIKKVTSLQAPHRIADAILRDSMLDNKKFRKSDVGKKLDTVGAEYATPLFEHCPTALVFGMWDSTGPRGGLGVKFARAIVSEIVGVNAVQGVKTSSRIDPLNIKAKAGPLYKADDGWTLDKDEAQKDKKKEAVKLGKDGKPSEANHGNVTPSCTDGSFTIEYAEQITVLSLPALRRLRFPIAPDQANDPEVDLAARSYLAALGLLGASLAVSSGYDLRSRCNLHSPGAICWELLGEPGTSPEQFSLTAANALSIAEQALEECKKAGLPFHHEEIILKPSAHLVTLVKNSIQLAAAGAEEAE